MINGTRIIIAFLVTAISNVAGAYTLRQIDNTDGLTNSAVLSLSQDETGRLWIGTCDGLNLFDGREVTSLGSNPAEPSLTGELIAAMTETTDNNVWISTNYGLYKYSWNDNRMKRFSQFQEMKNLSFNRLNHLFVVSRGNAVYYNMPEVSDNFVHLQGPALGRHDVFGVKATADSLLVFADSGVAYCSLSLGDEGYVAGRMTFIEHDSIAGCYIHGDDILHLGNNGMVRRFDMRAGVSRPVTSISHLIASRGDVSDMAFDSHGNLFVAFTTGGVVKLTPRNGFGNCEVEDIGVKGGAFCLLPDRNQDIVWVGSDGNGVYMYVNDEYSFRTFSYADMGGKITRPIRSVYIDGDGTLWLGTKGDGILKIRNFNPWRRGGDMASEVVSSSNSALADNSVYAMAAARNGGMWIGSDGGINYVAPGGHIYNVSAEMPLRFVHDIYHTGGDTLWIATVGNGVYSACVSGSFPAGVRLTGMKRYVVEDGNMNSNFFFSLHHDEGGRVLAGNRGFGLFAIENEKLSEVPLKGKYSTKTVSDVFSVTGTSDCLWLGTGNGLIKSAVDHVRVWNGSNGFPNSTIHSLIDDDNGNLWASTNRGLVRLDKETEQFQVYSRGSGLGVTEFSDGAAFSSGGTIYFGGINGLVALHRNPDAPLGKGGFIPSIFINGLKIDGREVDAAGYMALTGNGVKLSFSPDETTFSLHLSMPDYIDSDSYVYLYRFGGDENWIQSPTPGSLSFTSMPAGNHRLQIKAVNRATGRESHVRDVDIHIAAPWYWSAVAKVIYCLIALAAAWLAFRLWRRVAKRRHAEFMRKIRHEQKEKTYEEKLRFFTNITHEFCTPLTLIYGPCERILAHDDSDGYVRRYASLIKSNAERLNSLIQEIIDFRRVETGNQRLDVARMDVSTLCSDIVASFDVMKEQRGIRLDCAVEKGIIWPTDSRCFTKIVYNLVSNAFKYTPDNGEIKVAVAICDGNLRLTVYNTGKGIKPEDRSRIFNRYSILDNVEENATRGLSSRNGLGMAICHSMTKLLGGHISIDSEVGRYAEFIVTLPELAVTATGAEVKSDVVKLPQIPSQLLPDGDGKPAPKHQPKVSKPRMRGANMKRILVVDDNPDILSLLADCLDEYEVDTALNADEALEMAHNQTPDLIITDIMMPGTDGLQFAAALRRDRHMHNVPLVILSARNSTDDKVEGLQSGADAYVTKPFTPGYLKAVIERLLKGKSELKEYYNSSAPAYEYNSGKLVDKESLEFAEKLNAYIEENLASQELTPESLAAYFQISTRNLYRKMKDLGLQPPNDLIKDHRIALAVRLLLTTSLTVQEILYQCGFNNRSHFYKEFDRRYGMTPRDFRLKNRSSDATEHP